MVIKPLPHELSPQPEESHHVIYKRSVEQMEHLSDFGKLAEEKKTETKTKNESQDFLGKEKM